MNNTFKLIEPEQNTYLSLVADITHKCNMNCFNCYIPNRTIPDMDEKLLLKFITKLPQRIYIRLIGAEPTLRDDLPELISNIISLGHKVSLTTNGLKLSSIDYCKSLKNAGLKMVLISMNGADDDELYKRIDNGNYAQKKLAALENCLKLGFHVNTGTIIAKNINESALLKQLEVIGKSVSSLSVRTKKQYHKVPVVMRVKSVGALGRYMKDKTYKWDEFITLVAKVFDISKEEILNQPVASGANPIIKKPIALKWGYDCDGDSISYLIKKTCFDVPIYIRLINWGDGISLPDPGNQNRGRITPDFKIAPFFEHVKENEFNY